jgi:hypothetical protein
MKTSLEKILIASIKKQFEKGISEEDILHDLVDCDTGYNPEYTIEFINMIVKKAKGELK